MSNRDVSLRRDDGVTVHLLTNITPVHSAEGMVYETTAIDVTQLRQNQAELQRAKDVAVFESLNDPLTGLPNRRLLLSTLSLMLGMARAEGGMIALLYIDLDGFKLVNDSLGHPIGRCAAGADGRLSALVDSRRGHACPARRRRVHGDSRQAP